MSNVIKLDHPPPDDIDEASWKEAVRLSGHTKAFARRAPELHRALIKNIVRKLPKSRRRSREVTP